MYLIKSPYFLFIYLGAFNAFRAHAEVKNLQWANQQTRLSIEVLTDSAIHFEYATTSSNPKFPIGTSPMVLRPAWQYTGPTRWLQSRTQMNTKDIQIVI